MKRSALWLSCLALWSSGEALAMNEYYVSPTGSGSACTKTSPCGSLAQADATLAVGSAGACTAGSGWLSLPNTGACVHVLPGTYSPGSFDTHKNGTPSAQVVFLSETRWAARITGATWTQWGNWSNIEGFEMTAPDKANAITIQTGNNKGVDYNYLHDFGTSSCTLAGIVNQTNLPSHADHIVGNVIRQWGSITSSTCGQGYHGIYSDGDSVTIADNIISGGSGGWGIQRQYQPGHGSPSDCAPGVITNNLIFNNQGGIVVNEADVCPFSNWTVTNNIIIENGIQGTCHGFNGSSCGGSSFGIDYWGYQLGANDLVSNNMLFGNLPANLANHGAACTAGATCPSSNVKSDASPAATFVNFQPDTRGAPAPSFNVSNYQLRSGSAAVRGGTAACAASPGLNPCARATDFLGAAADSPPSLGALSVGGVGAVPPSAPTALTVLVR